MADVPPGHEECDRLLWQHQEAIDKAVAEQDRYRAALERISKLPIDDGTAGHRLGEAICIALDALEGRMP